MADTLELIKTLPPELREKISKEYIKIKLRERKAQGWDEVHDEIKKSPFCDGHQQIVKVFFCLEHNECGIDGICIPCFRKRNMLHNIFPDIDEYNSPKRNIEICDDELEHELIRCMAKGLDPNSLDYLLE